MGVKLVTIYKTVNTTDDKVVFWEELKPGKHRLKHGGLAVPIRVEPNDQVEVFVGEAEGNIQNLDVPGLNVDDYEFTQEVLETIRSIKVKPRTGESAVTLFGTEELLETFATVKKLGKPPVIGERARG